MSPRVQSVLGGLLWLLAASHKEVFYILEVVRGRFPFDTLKRKVMEVKRRYGSSTFLIEDASVHPERDGVDG